MNRERIQQEQTEEKAETGGAETEKGESRNRDRKKQEQREEKAGTERGESRGGDTNLAGTSWLIKSPSPAPSTLDSATYTIRAS
jgi:hypothetical protein